MSNWLSDGYYSDSLAMKSGPPSRSSTSLSLKIESFNSNLYKGCKTPKISNFEIFKVEVTPESSLLSPFNDSEDRCKINLIDLTKVTILLTLHFQKFHFCYNCEFQCNFSYQSLPKVTMTLDIYSYPNS